VETIPLEHINVTLQGQTGHPNGMQITATIKKKSRNIFVYAEQGVVSIPRSIHHPTHVMFLFIRILSSGFVPSELLDYTY
jgi:hypothetical protein